MSEDDFIRRGMVDQGNDISRIKEIIGSYSPKSGVKFTYERENKYGLFRPDREILMSDNELIEWAENFSGDTYDSFKDRMSFEEYENYMLKEARDYKKREGVGNIYIGSGNLEILIPGITDRINQEKGKIVFLENGLSEAPVSMALKYEKGELIEEPVIVDIFGYIELLEDLYYLGYECSQHDIPFPYLKQLNQTSNICKQITNGNLLAVNHFVNQKNIPRELKNASLLINSSLPASTLEKQLLMLAPGGQLYTYQKDVVTDAKYNVSSICDESGRPKASGITRID